MKTKAKKLKLSDVHFEVEAKPEHMAVRGNALASGDDKEDRECEDAIIADLESGNEWAWCCVKVTGTFHALEAFTYLGGCSYANKADFCADDGYLPSMKDEVLEDLQKQIDELVASGTESEI